MEGGLRYEQPAALTGHCNWNCNWDWDWDCDWDIYAKQPPCCLRPLWAPLAPPVWSRLDACSMHCWQQRQPDSSSQSETETGSGSGSLTVFALAVQEEDAVLLTLLLPSIYGHRRRGT